MPLGHLEPRDRQPSGGAGAADGAPSLLALVLGVGGFLAVSALVLYAVAWLGR